jgi:RNA polymerase sigma-70 factor, ECF subfamily
VSLTSAPDAVLAARAADGDADAFGVLVRRHGSYLLAFATRLTGSRPDAEDCVQEALITAWQKLPELAEPERVRAWMSTIVSRKATDRLRQRRTHAQVDETVPARDDPASTVVASSEMEALSRVLSTLPDDLRVPWVLREVSGRSYEQIATEVGESAATVRGRLARARRAVIDGMKEWR